MGGCQPTVAPSVGGPCPLWQHPPLSNAPLPGLAEQLDRRQGEGVDLGSDDFSCRLRREPLGVVAAITPWNYPREPPRCCAV